MTIRRLSLTLLFMYLITSCGSINSSDLDAKQDLAAEPKGLLGDYVKITDGVVVRPTLWFIAGLAEGVDPLVKANEISAYLVSKNLSIPIAPTPSFEDLGKFRSGDRYMLGFVSRVGKRPTELKVISNIDDKYHCDHYISFNWVNCDKNKKSLSDVFLGQTGVKLQYKWRTLIERGGSGSFSVRIFKY